MTQNQIAYQAHLERVRSNYAQEGLKAQDLKDTMQRFNRSNWHQAAANVGRTIESGSKVFSNVVKGVTSIVGLLL